MKIGLFGTHLCSRKKYGQVDTFSDIVRANYNAEIVIRPTGGGAQETQILEAVKSAPDMDVAIIAHAEFDDLIRNDKQTHFSAMKEIDELLLAKNVLTVHLIKKHEADLAFRSGPVDYEIVKFKDYNRFRTVRDGEYSDNCIDCYGNILSAKAIIKLIDQALAK